MHCRCFAAAEPHFVHASRTNIRWRRKHVCNNKRIIERIMVMRVSITGAVHSLGCTQHEYRCAEDLRCCCCRLRFCVRCSGAASVLLSSLSCRKTYARITADQGNMYRIKPLCPTQWLVPNNTIRDGDILQELSATGNQVATRVQGLYMQLI